LAAEAAILQRLPAYARRSTIRDWPYRVVMERHEACTMIAVTPVWPPTKGYYQPVKGFGCEGGSWRVTIFVLHSRSLRPYLVKRKGSERNKRMTPSRLPRPFYLLLPAITSTLHPVYTD
jgi:hypothetical protein